MARKDLNTESGYGYQGFKAANDNFIELYNQATLKTLPTTAETLAYINKTSDLSISPYVITLNGWETSAVSIDKLPPIGRGWWNIFHISALNGYPPWVQENLALQFWMLNGYSDNPTIYIRYCINNTWTQFKRILGSDNWITATLQNGWTGTLQYRKNNIGQLEIEAVIKSGTTNQGTVITTLPVGYRPYIARVPLLSAIGDDLSGGLGIVLADDGKIMVTSAAAGTSYTSNWYINATINHLQ